MEKFVAVVLARFLPTERGVLRQSTQQSPLDDESVLKLLLDTSIDFQNDVHKARAAYETLRAQHPSAPTFDDLSSLGWIRIVWGRVRFALGTGHALQQTSYDTQAALRPILAHGNERRFIVGSVASGAPELAPTIAEMQSTPAQVHHLPCPTPSWVIARLWDRAPVLLSPQERLRFWLDRCNLLPDCYFAPASAWDAPTAEAFRAAALAVLAADPGLLSWDGFRSRLVSRSATVSGRTKTEIQGSVGSIPATFVDRYLWLNGRDWERVNDGFDTCGDLWLLTNYLLCEIEDADLSASPNPVAHHLFELASERPELLEFITLRIRDMPVVLADMTLEPRLAALACMLIVRWAGGTGAWDRELRARDDRSARLSAFTDAVAVVVYFVETQSLASAELAALLSWLHEQANARPYMSHQEPRVDDQMLRTMRSELSRLPPEILRAVAEACLTSERPNSLGSSSFAAALDVMTLGMLSDVLEPETFIAPYLLSVRSGGYLLSAAGITTTGAGALVRLAQRASRERWLEFLSPLDVRALLAKGREPGANPFMVRDDVSRSVRAHVRILCRAIVSWDDIPSPELIDGLLQAVRSGAIAHEEKGRVAAFSAQYEADPSGSRTERPIAADLGEALVSLVGSNRERLLAAILETDEPLVLAQLIAGAPDSTRGRIRDRINALTPMIAGDVSSLTEAHARIEALLQAGAADAAASFIAAERQLKTLGRVPGRELTQLRMNMRLWLLRGDFASIANAETPAGLKPNEEGEAQSIVAFYRALAELWKTDGDLDSAEREFKRLHENRREVPAYATNLLAARVSRLLSGNLFGRVCGADAVVARVALADAERAMERWIGADDEDRTAHNCNMALLLMSIGQPERAYEMLEGSRSLKRQDRIAAYSAVALSRMGRDAEASEALGAAGVLFGESDALRSARAQVQREAPLDERATTSLTDDPVGPIKAALFALSQMDAMRQADVLSDSPGGFDGLVTGHVRSAAASVVALVPMMRDVQLDSCEDDLTALFQAILAARLEFFGWSLADQSKGGFTAKGNPGERDLVLRKGPIILSVLEAVVCARPAKQQWTKGDLANHFQRLLGYSNCRLFFHLVYSYVADPGEVVTELRRIAEKECPPGFSFTRLQELPPNGSAPTGFWASYASSLGEAKVVFLLLDMGQEAQRGAARAAAQSNPRNDKKAGA
jgi:tetratricopeptide (TPR) repeat protein